MQIQAEIEKWIITLLKELPAEQVDEIIDFAEYLKARKKAGHKLKGKKRPLGIPTFHMGRIDERAFDRDTLYGEYLDRKFA